MQYPVCFYIRRFICIVFHPYDITSKSSTEIFFTSIKKKTDKNRKACQEEEEEEKKSVPMLPKMTMVRVP